MHYRTAMKPLGTLALTLTALLGFAGTAHADHGPDGCTQSAKPATLHFRYVILGGVERTQVRSREVVCAPRFPTSQWVIASRTRWFTVAPGDTAPRA